MRYGVRIGIGALVGLVAVVGFSLLADAWWIAALAGLLGPVAFLATYFVWSADRPDIGYEQVLFDMPNSVVSGIFALAFVGAALGLGQLGGADAPEGPQLSPEETAAFASLNEQGNALRALTDELQAEPKVVEKIDGWLVATRASETALQALVVPEPFAPLRESLLAEAAALAGALEANRACLAGDSARCTDARIAIADAQLAGNDYAEGAKALGLA